MRADHFGSWGRPFEYNAQLYRSVNRPEEARDSVSDQRPALMLNGMQLLCYLAGNCTNLLPVLTEISNPAPFAGTHCTSDAMVEFDQRL
jgi:hypothetical protein